MALVVEVLAVYFGDKGIRRQADHVNYSLKCGFGPAGRTGIICGRSILKYQGLAEVAFETPHHFSLYRKTPRAA
jgi:hypothetical protein